MEVDLVVNHVPCPDGWASVWRITYALLVEAAERAGRDEAGSNPGGTFAGDGSARTLSDRAQRREMPLPAGGYDDPDGVTGDVIMDDL